jgi:competence protein ComFC
LLINLIFPRTCSGCGHPGQYLCPRCHDSLTLKSIVYNPSTSLEGRLSLFRYHGHIKQIITDLKFNFTSDLIPEIVNLIAHSLVNRYPNLLRYWQDNDYTLTPIPLHSSRFNWRGFNQSELLAAALSPLLNLKYENILTRTKNTLPQTSIKDKRLRRANTVSSFQMINDKCLNPPAGRAGDKFILVDDVYTTGSTIRSAASAFPPNTHLWALTIAG